jgi:hypothetical protein
MSRMAGYARLGGPMNLNGYAGTCASNPSTYMAAFKAKLAERDKF